jgi:hypothetical protein
VAGGVDGTNDLDEASESVDITTTVDITMTEAIFLLGDNLGHEGIARLIQPVMELDLRMQGVSSHLIKIICH